MIDRGMRTLIAGLLLSACIFSFADTANAEEKQFYLGVGGSYQLTNFDGDLKDWDSNIIDAVDWDSHAWGVNVKFGYRLARTLYLQIDLDYIPEVEGASSSDNEYTGDVDVYTGIFSLKGYFPNFVKIKPFVIAGAGIMHYKADINETATSSGYYLNDDKETHLCFKVGGGLDFFVTEAFSIGLEGNYTSGIEDVSQIKYYNFILGAAYHF